MRVFRRAETLRLCMTDKLKKVKAGQGGVPHKVCQTSGCFFTSYFD